MLRPYLFMAVFIFSFGSGLALAGVGNNPTLKEYSADTTLLPEIIAISTNEAAETIVEIKSPSWRSAKELIPNAWQHQLTIKKGNQNCKGNIFIFITGGALHDKDKIKTHPLLNLVNGATNCASVQIDLIPNQGLVVAGEKEPRFEDQILAYSFTKYFKSKDSTWIGLFPMVRSVILTMNLLTKKSEEWLGHGANGFVLSGQSKRGWTTWLTAAVDERVKGIVPVVIDFLNTKESLENHHKFYGTWSDPLKPYVDEGVLAKLDSKEFEQLQAQVDPYAYKSELTLPKYIVNAANDQFFTPDSSKLYFHELLGDSFLRYVPNSGHHIDQVPGYMASVKSFVKRIEGTANPLPTLRATWNEKENQFLFLTSASPTQIIHWRAYNAKARDFRLRKEGFAKYVPKPVSKDLWKNGVLKLVYEKPGHYADFIEFTWETGESEFVLTSQVAVVSK